MWPKMNFTQSIRTPLRALALMLVFSMVSIFPALAQGYQQRLADSSCYDDVVALVNDLAAERGVQVSPPAFAASPLADQDQTGRLTAFNAGTLEPIQEPQPGQFLGLAGVAGGISTDPGDLPPGVYEVRFRGYTGGGQAAFMFLNVDTGEIVTMQALLQADPLAIRFGFSVHVDVEWSLIPPKIVVHVTFDFKLFGRVWKKTFTYRLL